ncbi:uncharacterized protein LOC133518613 isoform X4 [Cydia pomonella]|uniref:uncharacterized protein LOC133518613 isoform X4 n=1 Tax=Cydia pomonella TaxID=82600 RepID=UPI002ADE94AE|nr:uncharacterized protein LOC133518613 isoform X4 [Cydia pomonella]XP_061708265.1 uncharacterized protein LOC133518613 isoform X4 [Cydia pomonella]
MWEYLAVLLLGFWLGVAIFLYVSCYWLEEILDLPATRDAAPSASNAHAQLKRLVARVVEEAAALPALARYAAEPQAPHDTYEDLLATAILNKVIERYQTEGSGGRSSGIHSASASPSPSDRSSPRSLNTRHTRDISPPLREEDDVSDWEEGATEETVELPRRVPFPDFSEETHHTENGDRDFDEVSGSEIQSIDGTWEENWLFQKKKIKTIQSVPVPMLVPNSNAEYKAMIGDRDADDTTDLSDNASDNEPEELDYKSDIKRVLESKHVIGGAPSIDELDFEPDSLTIIDGSDDFEKLDEKEYMKNKLVDVVNNEVKGYHVNVEKINGNVNGKLDDESVLIVGMDSGPLTKAEFALKEEIHRTILNGNVDAYIEDLKTKENDEVFTNGTKTQNKNTLSRHEREREDEETVTLPVQRYADSLRRKHFDDEPQQIPTRDTDHEDDLIPGSIAYRERKKWLNYVEMPNNPYSPEAIQKRLSSKSTSSLFDTLTSKSKIEDSVDIVDGDVKDGKEHNEDKEVPVKELKPSLSVSSDDVHMNGSRSKSPSPKILKDVLAEEIPQYKRYGRDYYVREAKSSTGSRKKGLSETSSLSSINKSTSLDNVNELTSPVSASSSLSDLEACTLHQNIVRAVLSPRNASPNFAINPIFETDRQNDNADENHADERNGRDHGLLIKQFNSIASNQRYKTLAGNEVTIKPIPTKDIMIEYEDANEQTLFSAKPVYVDEDEKKFEELLQTCQAPLNVSIVNIVEEPQKSPSNLSVDNSYLSSSSLEDSIKIYNVQTGEIVKCKPDDKLSEPRYESDGSDNIETQDKKDEAVSLTESDVVIVDDEIDEEKSENISEIEDILSQLPKVKELAKKFVSMENLNEPIKPPQPAPLKRQKSKENLLSEKQNKLVYMHSLTARSISKEFREELKLSMATPLKVPGGSNEIPEGTEDVIKESSRPPSPMPEPGTIKTKLAFFESLKSKFSSK